MYRIIEPEVAGGLGPETIMNTIVHPPVVSQLNYEFYGWLGDDILESFPCYIVSDRLKNRIVSENLTGVHFEQVIITQSEFFKELYPTKELPTFHWAQIDGELQKDDFIFSNDYRLVISEKAYAVLNLFNVKHASFEEIIST